MNRETATAESASGLFVLAVLSLVVGAITGLVGAAFRLTLDWVSQWRGSLVAAAHEHGPAGLALVIAGCATAATVAAGLVRWLSPHASGSGIPHVEAVLKGKLPPAPYRLIPVKFAGGVLAIGAGLALGREGPSVQMGATLAHLIGRLFRRNWPDCRVLFAAGAGAGLATAFNAPIAGAVFVLEELVRRFETRIAIAALGASSVAIVVARLFLGDTPELHVSPWSYAGPLSQVLAFALGAIAGLAGVVYNWAILKSLATLDGLRWCPVECRAALAGVGIGVLAWLWPDLVGGGESLTQQTLAGAFDIHAIAIMFAVRFALGPASYAARTPGGLFAPMLAVGAQLGILCWFACQQVVPGFDATADAFAVVGMAAFFSGVVRAPVTGIVLIVEMTGSFPMLLPMVGACFTAMLVPTLVGDPPIYDSLRERPASGVDERR